MTNLSNQTLLSAPCYMDADSTGHRLVGIVNVLLDLRTLLGG